MSGTRKHTPLNSSDFTDILNGALRYDAVFNSVYRAEERIGDFIVLENYEIAPDESGMVEIKSAVKPLTVTFLNCIIKEIEISVAINELILENCEIDRIMFTSGVVDKMTVKTPKKAIQEILVNKSLLSELNIDGVVNNLFYKGNDPNKISKGNLNGVIKKLEVHDCNSVSLQAKGIIEECSIVNSDYPFERKPVTIQKLKISSVKKGEIHIRGLFESVHFIDLNANIYISTFTCINDFTIEQRQSNQIKINLIDTYIGGALILNNVAPELTTLLDDNDNKFIFINKLEIKKSLINVSIRSIIGEKSIHINHLSFTNIHLNKDVYWSLQGIYLESISFINFRNAGVGNISNTISGSFLPSTMNYQEFLEIYKNEELKSSFFIEHCLQNDKYRRYELYLRSSDLGKINFMDTDFSEFKLSFYSTKLSEIFLAGSKMPKIVRSIETGTINKDLKHQERIANSQLKKLHEQQGDLLAANDYFANEMNAYNESLSWRLFFWEKLPLVLNRISSNHGQSWIRALSTTLIISVIFYMIFLKSMDYALADPVDKGNLSLFFHTGSFFLDFINPLHKLDTFEGLNGTKEFRASTRFIDGIARIFIAYFVYQLIQAFRKHGRSK